MGHHWHFNRNADRFGHFERSRDDGKTWETCTQTDAILALGGTTARALREQPSQARPHPRSQYGLVYRYIPAVAAEPVRQAG